jgi:hypothetical protein
MFDCLPGEIEQNISVERALHEIEAGEEFAFYNLSLSLKDRELLDSIEIIKWDNIVLNSKSFNTSLEEEINTVVASMTGISIIGDGVDQTSNLFARLAKVVLGQVGATEFEMHIRTKKAGFYEYSCVYWHLDKSQAEVIGEENVATERRFIIPLIGTGTFYQKITSAIRSEFLEIAEEYTRYYGHGLEDCVPGNKISFLLDASRIYKPEIGFGSVHVAARNGALHAEPNDNKDRLLLIITPL